LLQVVIVALAGSLIFGVSLGSNYTMLALGLLLAPAVFTALGLLLAAFVSNEGSAILSSLLISMPMLFLSGIILPIELLHGTFRAIGTILPLYNVVEMISKVTVRDSLAYAGGNYFACMLYTFLFLFFAYFAWRNKE
jgi:ABC-2 type transport system permease protein